MIKLLKALINKLRSIMGRYDVTLPYIITIFLALIFIVGGINLFIELTETLTTDELKFYDDTITDFVISHRSPLLNEYFTFVTRIGDLYGYIIVVILSAFVSLVVFKKWKYMAQITLVLTLSALSNLVLKRFINRARPDIEHLVTVETLSYPSGHAMAAMAFYGFLMYLFYKFKMSKRIKVPIILLLAILIISIGLSRIYLGVHFPSDIAGGFIAGAIWVIFCIILFNIIEVFRRDPKTPGGIEKMDAIED